MGIFRGIGGTGNSTDDGVVDAVTAQAVIATNKATEAANSATSAYNDAQSASTSKDTAITQANAAQSSANNASDSATNASTSATSAATSATSATASATTATTKASEAATSATNAATSETNAATSATTATTKASEAATSATTATTKASEASTSATNAASSATSASTSASTATTKASEASTSAANAASSYDSFDDRYLGAKSSAPSVDNDGDALITGALYFDTTSDSMKVYSGSAWLDAYATLSGALIATNNLSDLNNVSTARTNLGLGTAATTDASAYATAAQADQTVSLTGAGATSISGTYPNFTITSTDTNTTYSVGDGGLTQNNFTDALKTNYDTAYSWGNHASAGYLTGNQTITLSGDVSGSGTTSISVTVADDSHNHVISNVDGLQTALDAKAPLASPTFTGTVTATALTVDTDTLHVDATNNRVGIGTASPAQELHLKGSGEMARLESISATGNTWMTFHSPSARLGYFGYGSASDTHLRIVNDTSGDILASTNGSERMRIDSSGNVGIGDTTPSAKLDVNGAVLVQGGTFTAGIDSGTAGIVLQQDKPIFSRDVNGNYLRNLIKHTSAGAIEIGQSGTSLINGITLTAGSSGHVVSNSKVLVGTTDDTLSNNTSGSGVNLSNGVGSASTFCRESTGACIILNKTGTTNFGTIQQFRKNGTAVGSISVGSSTTAYNTSSDYRLKENVVPLTGATERLKQLNPTRFNFISDADTTVDGFLAHEVSDIVPEAITGTKDGTTTEEYVITPAVTDESGEIVTEAVIGTREVPEYQGIDQSKLVPLLVATIQELEARITALEAD